jgi:microcystin degradation protein MlrC
VIANKGDSFITVGHFNAAGLNMDDYDVIVVKQGYLFAELAALAKLHIMALTPGATYQLFHKLEFHHIPRPCYPFDQVESEAN